MIHARVIKVKNPEEMGKVAADLFETLIQTKPACVLGLATGSSPLPLYRELVERCKAGKIDFSRVRSANLDEYKGLSGDHPQSYRYFMQENLFNHVNIKPENTIVPNGQTEDVAAMCQAYEKQIEEWGGVDLQLLGMGHNGHIAFNEPGDNFGLGTHVVSLSERTIDANQRFFENRDDVPRHALSMGIKNIMNARRILMVVSGEDKADAVCKAVTGPVTDQVPASVLQLHPDVTLVGDTAALSKLKEAGVPVCG